VRRMGNASLDKTLSGEANFSGLCFPSISSHISLVVYLGFQTRISFPLTIRAYFGEDAGTG